MILLDIVIPERWIILMGTIAPWYLVLYYWATDYYREKYRREYEKAKVHENEKARMELEKQRLPAANAEHKKCLKNTAENITSPPSP